MKTFKPGDVVLCDEPISLINDNTFNLSKELYIVTHGFSEGVKLLGKKQVYSSYRFTKISESKLTKLAFK